MDVNSYCESAQLSEVQKQRLTDASLVNIEPKGRPLNNLSFGFVCNDCCGSSQPAACAIRAHMDFKQHRNGSVEQTANRDQPTHRGDQA